jgi:hypothetical protein
LTSMDDAGQRSMDTSNGAAGLLTASAMGDSKLHTRKFSAQWVL